MTSVTQFVAALECARGTTEHMGSDASETFSVLSEALRSFEGSSLEDLRKALTAIKPKPPKVAKRTRAATVLVDTNALVSQFSEELSRARGDVIAISEIVARMRANPSVKKAEAVEIAKRGGARVSSKTTKALALQAIETIADRAQREQMLAEKIRQGV